MWSFYTGFTVCSNEVEKIQTAVRVSSKDCCIFSTIKFQLSKLLSALSFQSILKDNIPKIAVNVLFCFICLFVCFVALRPKSTAMVIAGRSVHLTTLFPRQA